LINWGSQAVLCMRYPEGTITLAGRPHISMPRI